MSRRQHVVDDNTPIFGYQSKGMPELHVVELGPQGHETVLVLSQGAKRLLAMALHEPGDIVVLSIPREKAEALAQAWENDADCQHLQAALRDALNGQDGFLHTLNAALGREH